MNNEKTPKKNNFFEKFKPSNIALVRKEKREKEIQKKIENEKRIINYNTLVAKELENRKMKKVAPKDAYISLVNVNKVYDNLVQAVYDFNLNVQKNEFIVLVGPSGCGKSTTLRMIAGLEEITAGNLFIDGVYANPLPPKERDIAMVFQSYALYPTMTVKENLAFSLKIRKMDKQEIEDRIMKTAKILQIEDYLDRKPRALSGGQRQRVALGRAIVRNSKFFLMDEPLSNLDAKLRVSMRAEIIKLHRLINATTIYVTHDQTEAMTMADRIVIMNKGYIQQVGTPEEIYNFPSNEFVSTFIGSPSMNIVPVTINKNVAEFNNKVKIKLLDEHISAIEKYFSDKLKVLDEYLANGLQIELDNELLVKKYHFKAEKHKKDEDVEALANELTLNEEEREICKQRFEEKSKSKEETRKIYRNIIKTKKFSTHLGVRPEDCYIANDLHDPSVDPSLEVPFKVSLTELLGNEYHVHGELDGKEFIIKTKANKKIPNDTVLSISLDLNKVHLFDILDTNRIF